VDPSGHWGELGVVMVVDALQAPPDDAVTSSVTLVHFIHEGAGSGFWIDEIAWKRMIAG
jgi:hypothetical protein